MTETLVVVIILGFLWFSFQYGWWRPTVPMRYPRILMYHMIAHHKPRARFNKLRVEPNDFDKQVKWLKENGWQFVFMSELEDSQVGKRVALTFDDGYRDNLIAADPILERYGGKATLFLTVDRHEKGWSSKKNEKHSDLELMLEPKLLDEDIRHMLNSGRWEIGSHGISHENLLRVPDDTKKSEISESKTKLEGQFSTPVISFAYPFGYYQQSDVRLVQESNYRFGLTTDQGVSEDFLGADAFTLKRVKISGQGGMLMFKLRMRTGKCRFKD